VQETIASAKCGINNDIFYLRWSKNDVNRNNEQFFNYRITYYIG